MDSTVGNTVRKNPPATRSELFTPFQPSIDSPWRVKSQTSLFKGNRPSREPGYSSHHIASGWDPALAASHLLPFDVLR